MAKLRLLAPYLATATGLAGLLLAVLSSSAYAVTGTCSGGCCRLAAPAVACGDVNCTCKDVTRSLCATGSPDECDQ